MLQERLVCALGVIRVLPALFCAIASRGHRGLDAFSDL
jgi:hypothetical protein